MPSFLVSSPVLPVAKRKAPAEWQGIHKIATFYARIALRELLSAISSIQDRVSERAINEAYASGVVSLVDRLIFEKDMIDKLTDSLLAITEKAISEGADEGIPVLAKKLRSLVRKAADPVVVSFDIKNPRVTEAINTSVGNMITGITTQQRDAVRNLLNDAYQKGSPPRLVATQLKAIIGLDSRSAKAVGNYQAALVGQNLKPQIIQKRVAAYGERLLKQRVENIARTETLRAANMGQQLLWEQSAVEGLIDSKTVQRRWILTPDDRLCPRCADLRGKQVALTGTFSQGNATVLTPPLHPRCRCAIGLAEINLTEQLQEGIRKEPLKPKIVFDETIVVEDMKRMEISSANAVYTGVANGKKVVIKPVVQKSEAMLIEKVGLGLARTEEKAEYSAVIVARRLGVNTPDIKIGKVKAVISSERIDDYGQSIVSDFVEGKNGHTMWGMKGVPNDVREGEEGRRLRMFDYVIFNFDRHAGNVMVNGKQLTAIDHGYAFPILSKEKSAPWSVDFFDLHQPSGTDLTGKELSLLKRMKLRRAEIDAELTVSEEAKKAMWKRVDHAISTRQVPHPTNWWEASR